MKGGRRRAGTPPSDTETQLGGSCVNPLSSQQQQERYLPIANVSRIMKRSVPGNAKISKEAKETVQECVSEFISFVTGEASDKCQREKRKTINGDDLLWAMSTLGFHTYLPPLNLYLASYRDAAEVDVIKNNSLPAPDVPTSHDHHAADHDPDTNTDIDCPVPSLLGFPPAGGGYYPWIHGGGVHGVQW